jgi:hypothetical protein
MDSLASPEKKEVTSDSPYGYPMANSHTNLITSMEDLLLLLGHSPNKKNMIILKLSNMRFAPEIIS